jgi:hypothetical protein
MNTDEHGFYVRKRLKDKKLIGTQMNTDFILGKDIKTQWDADERGWTRINAARAKEKTKANKGS